MLFKLSMKNIKKSIKDYAIYFMTLILGIAVFYVFNSMDTQEPIQNFAKSSYDVVGLMVKMLSGLSVFISIVLGFLIIYANNFLIKRRKKEFGIYLILGMGKGQLSKILFLETLFIGIISLFVGLILGIFASQFMSIIVASMFEADMNEFKFVFSSGALFKTILYFSLMYIFVMIFNTFVINKYKLIDLITGSKKVEKIKMRSPFLSVLLFIISIIMLGFAYYKVTIDTLDLSQGDIVKYIIIGAASTFLFFFSLSGFVLKLVKSCKKLYYKNLNMFVLKQINSKINTTVVSMSIICLMLFTTICMLSAGLAMNKSLTSELTKYNPVDITISKTMMLPNNGEYSPSAVDFSEKSINEVLEDMGYDVENDFKDFNEVSTYTADTVTLKDTLKSIIDEIKKETPTAQFDAAESIMKVSDYNKIARVFGNEEISLKEGEYAVVCNYDMMTGYRNKALKMGTEITINGKTYKPSVSECYDGFIEDSIQAINLGIIIVPDSTKFTNEQKEINYFNANYNLGNEEQKADFENKLTKEIDENSGFKDVEDYGINISTSTRMYNYESSKGLGATVTFIGIYLGIIFLITSAAILALKELSESADNIERYKILRKIGTSEKMINKALFMQIGIFFILPLLLAVIHSIFGLKFSDYILSTIGHMNILPSIIVTAIAIILIYGGYFLITYFSSKKIIKEK
ncbi:ABC transporter permease [Anaerofustis sp. NSJ-163]|uniref:ABC transporter permease n=1 Tax=Anaerofustis sp. NSJ-163 TaxID=2944391 RepID=UPI00209C3F60|nr:ABC transporter permease [Anaerofustis sp. NSJ-163]MCO8193665.1 ABC transporter permease [Anaerofustis sp. NSJ-163]